MVSMFEGPSTGEDVAGGASDEEIVGVSWDMDATGSTGADVVSGTTSEVEVSPSSAKEVLVEESDGRTVLTRDDGVDSLEASGMTELEADVLAAVDAINSSVADTADSLVVVSGAITGP